ncbi:MAG: hypothetical protein KDA54_19530 [Phycisphaerales bacterium]|nr:hypothetical protein [Phycisphaerales bacterium]
MFLAKLHQLRCAFKHAGQCSGLERLQDRLTVVVILDGYDRSTAQEILFGAGE